MKIDVALAEAHAAEVALARELARVGDAHRTDHDVFHLSRTLGGWCDEHVRRLAGQGARYGVELAAAPDAESGVLGRVRETAAERDGRRSEPGLLLLRDLRELHLAAARTSLAWTMLGQGAQAVGDQELLAVVGSSHPEAVRTLKWTVQKVKEASPQVLAS